MTFRPTRILIEIDVSGLSLIEAEKAARTLSFSYGSTDARTPARAILERVEEVEE